MIFIYSLLIVTILSIVFSANIKSNYKVYYVFASVISVLVSFYEVLRIVSHPNLNSILLNFEKAFIKGNVAVSFFILVMFAGALSTRQLVGRKIISIRAELAILGSIFILPHGVIYLARFFILKLPKILMGKTNSALYLTYISIGVIAFIIMFPLFITSFKSIRKKLGGLKWKKLHKWAYVFYLLVYIHIILVLVNGKIDFVKIISYTCVFLLYTLMKLKKHRKV